LNPGSNPDDNVADMPIGSLWKMHPEQKDLMLVAKTFTQEDMPRAIDQIEQLLRIRRGVATNKESDFSISTQDTFTDLWNQISSGIFTVMFAISSIAPREIGIRKAIGATQRHILTQFLIEAMALTAVGGILGILVGGAIAVLIRNLVPFLPASVSLFWVSVGFVTSVGTGLIFGMYPAYRAAILSPIEALRYE
ncbi:MAG: ABC transporter permease, partial [Acidobacteria bacterium]